MKKMLPAILSCALALSLCTPALAGEWRHDEIGWWYRNDDGSYQRNGWFQDGDGRYYYFTPAGYMLADTVTPDGYYVDASGAWVPGRQGAASGRDFTYAEYMRTIPALKHPRTDYYDIYLAIRDAAIIDRGDCFEIKNVKIYRPVEYISRGEAEQTLANLRITEPDPYEDGGVIDSGYGTYVIMGMDEVIYSRHIWTGSVYARKDAAIRYSEYGYDGTAIPTDITLEQYLDQAAWKDFPFWDCVIRSIDGEGYVTEMTGAMWG